MVDNICAVADAIVEKIKNTPSREYVKTISCFFTEGVLCTRALQASQKLYRTSKANALQYINNPSSKAMVTTAEGIELQITARASEVVLEKSGIQKFAKNKKGVGGARPVILKVENMEEFFEKTSFGKKLFDYCERAGNGRYKMTKKLKEYGLYKGDCFYLDKLHNDHLEVFGYRGDFVTVLNLDGTINYKKAARARRQARSIKDMIK